MNPASKSLSNFSFRSNAPSENFRLFERRFGNSNEASQILDLLKLEIVYLTGGQNKNGGPIILFPPNSSINQISSNVLILLLRYVASIPSEESAKKGFTIIIDNSGSDFNTIWTNLLTCCQDSLAGSIFNILIVEIFTNNAQQIIKEEYSSNFEVYRLPINGLTNFITPNELTLQYGGHLIYNHDKWIATRLFLEHFVKEVQNVGIRIEQFYAQLTTDLLQTNNALLLDQVYNDQKVLQLDAEKTIAQGMEFKRQFVDDIERCNVASASNLPMTTDEFIVLQRIDASISSVGQRMEKLEEFWRKREELSRKKMHAAELAAAIKTVIDWVEGPGDKLLSSQTRIGDDLKSSDELRKMHEQLELKCFDSYGMYAELRHKIDAMVTSDAVDDATNLIAERDHMDSICRAFATRLEQRRNVVITCVRYYRLLNEAYKCLDDLHQLLKDDILVYDLKKIEEIIALLDKKSNQIKSLSGHVTSNGQSLLSHISQQSRQNPELVQRMDSLEEQIEMLVSESKKCGGEVKVRRLMLEQLLQLRMCEQNVQQAIEWLYELNSLSSMDKTSSNSTQDFSNTDAEKLEHLGKMAHEHGLELLNNSLMIRRNLGLDLQPSDDLMQRLNEAWKKFSRGNNERILRRKAILDFSAHLDDFWKKVDDMEDEINKNQIQYPKIRTEMKDEFKKVENVARDLIKRLQQPLFNEDSNEIIPMNSIEDMNLINHRLQVLSGKLESLENKEQIILQNNRASNLYSSMRLSKSSPRISDIENSQSSIDRVSKLSKSFHRMPDKLSRSKSIDGRLQKLSIQNNYEQSNHLREYSSYNGENNFTNKKILSPDYLSNDISFQNNNALNNNLNSVNNQHKKIFYDNNSNSSYDPHSYKIYYYNNSNSSKLNNQEPSLNRNSMLSISSNNQANQSQSLNERYSSDYNSVQRFSNSSMKSPLSPSSMLNFSTHDLKSRDTNINKFPTDTYLTQGYKEESNKATLYGNNSLRSSLNSTSFGRLGNEHTSSINRSENDRLSWSMNSHPSVFSSKSGQGSENMTNDNQIKKWFYYEIMNNLHNSMYKSPKETFDFYLYLNKMMKEKEETNNWTDVIRHDNGKFISDWNNAKNLIEKRLQISKAYIAFLNDTTKLDRDMKLLESMLEEIRQGRCSTEAASAKASELLTILDEDYMATETSGLNYLNIAKMEDYHDHDLLKSTEIHLLEIRSRRTKIIELIRNWSKADFDDSSWMRRKESNEKLAKILIRPLENKTFKTSDRVIFECQLDPKANIKEIEWYHDNKKIKFPGLKYFSSNRDGGCSLIVDNANASDAGVYEVVVKRNDGLVDHSVAHLINADAPTIVRNLKDIQSKEKDFAELSVIVNSQTPVKASWKKDSVTISNSHKYKLGNQGNSYLLTISDLHKDDEGIYFVVLTNEFGAVETSCQLSVQGDPKMSKIQIKSSSIVQPSNKVQASIRINSSDGNQKSFKVGEFEQSLKRDLHREMLSKPIPSMIQDSIGPSFTRQLQNCFLTDNNNAKFSCQVAGKPIPDIQWYNNGRLIRPSSKYKMSFSQDGECVLVVVSPRQPEDLGYYTCCATNFIGRESSSAELKMYGETNIDRRSYVSEEGLRLMTDKKSPRTNSNVNEESGVSEIYEEPVFTTPLCDLQFSESEPLRLECKVRGTPTPELKWLKDGVELHTGAKCKIFVNQQEFQTFFIKLPTRSDEGVYSCCAVNRAGKVTTSARITYQESSPRSVAVEDAISSLPLIRSAFADDSKVKMSSKQMIIERQDTIGGSLESERTQNQGPHISPQIDLRPEFIDIREGDSAKFVAIVSAQPEAKVVWLLNDNPITSGGRYVVKFDGLMHTFELLQTKCFDTGIVKIEARNYLGMATKSGHLKIENQQDYKSFLKPIKSHQIDDDTIDSISSNFSSESRHSSLIKTPTAGKLNSKTDLHSTLDQPPKSTNYEDLFPKLKTQNNSSPNENSTNYKTTDSVADSFADSFADPPYYSTSKLNWNSSAKPFIKRLSSSTASDPINSVDNRLPTSNDVITLPADNDVTLPASTDVDDSNSEKKLVSTIVEEVTMKESNNVPQKLSTRVLKTFELTTTDRRKSLTSDVTTTQPSTDPPTGLKYTIEDNQQEYTWNNDAGKKDFIDELDRWKLDVDSKKKPVVNGNGDPVEQSSKWLAYEDAQMRPSSSDNSAPKPFVKDIGDRPFSRDSNLIVPRSEYATVGLSNNEDDESKTLEVETIDEVTLETKVTQINTIEMLLSETGGISLTERTEVQTDTDLKEVKKRKERQEVTTYHGSEVADAASRSGFKQLTSSPNDTEVNYPRGGSVAVMPAKLDFYSSWTVEPRMYVALASYEPDDEDVMSLHDGEKVELLDEKTEDLWLVRKIFDDRRGFVPSAYLQSKTQFDRVVSDDISDQVQQFIAALNIGSSGTDSVAPYVVRNLKNLHVLDGDRVHFECEITGRPKPVVTWFCNSKRINPSPDFLQFYEDDGVCSLDVREAYPEDGGRYTVVANNCAGLASASCELTVSENSDIKIETAQVSVVKGQAPTLVTKPKAQVVDEGEDVTFSCHVTGDPLPKIVWLKNDQKLVASKHVQIESLESENSILTSMTIFKATADDTAKYKVLLNNDNGESTITVSLTVREKEKISDFKSILKSSKKEKEKLNEIITSEKTEFYNEMHSHTEQAFSSRDNLEQAFSSRDNLEQAFSSRDNLASTKNSDLNVSNIDVDAFKVKTRPYDVSIKEGEVAKFVCQVQPAVAPLQAKWFFQGKPIANSEMFRVTSSDDGWLTLEIPQASVDDAGCYTVRATCPLGTVESSAILYVEEVDLEDVTNVNNDDQSSDPVLDLEDFKPVKRTPSNK